MSEVIKAYYEKTKLEKRHITSKLNLFNAHKDIEYEFEYWIKNGEYLTKGVSVEGYTAEELSKQSEFLDGEGAFILLIELRNNPSRVRDMLKEGFKFN